MLISEGAIGSLAAGEGDVLYGTVAGSSSTTAAIAGTPRVTGTVSGVSSTTSGVSGSPEVIGTVPGSSSTTSSIVGSPIVIGAVSGASSTTADIDGTPRVTGTVSGSSSTVASIEGTPDITGSLAPGTSITLADIDGTPRVIGTVSGSSGTTADIDGTPRVIGEVDGISSTTSAIAGTPRVTGFVSGVTTTTALITVPVTLNRVQPLKIEDPDTGSQDDDVPTALDKNQDYIDTRGIAFQNSTSDDSVVLVYRDDSDNLTFTDPVLGSTKTLSALADSISSSQHPALLQLAHFVDEGPAEGFVSGATKTTTYSGSDPTQELWRRSDNTKLVEKSITYTGADATTIQWKIYAANGTTVLKTMTDTITYAAGLEQTRTRTIV